MGEGTTPFTRIDTSHEGSVAVVTLASDKVNALDPEVLAELDAGVAACEGDPDVGALVVTGRGRAFSAGVNVTYVIDGGPAASDAVLDGLASVVLRLLRFPKPTVAAVNGPAIAGGCLLALACDHRLIAEEARIGVTELAVGVAFPVWAVDLVRHATGAGAEPLLLGAALLGAEEARSAGFVHQVVAADELDVEAVKEAGRRAAFDPRAYALAKTTSRRDLLAGMATDAARHLDASVREQWRAEETRSALTRLRDGSR